MGTRFGQPEVVAGAKAGRGEARVTQRIVARDLSAMPATKRSGDKGTFAVPRAALKDMEFTRFDEDFHVTEEARIILGIDEDRAKLLRELALEFLPKFRSSQSERMRKSSNPKFSFEVTPASDEEAARLIGEFREAVSGVVGDERARQLPFPIEINTGNIYQVFSIARPSEPGEIRVEVGKIEQEDGIVFNQWFDTFIHLAPDEPLPERWQHLIALETFDEESVQR